MQVRETAMERYAIKRMTDGDGIALFPQRNDCDTKYRSYSGDFPRNWQTMQKTGSRRGLRSFGEGHGRLG